MFPDDAENAYAATKMPRIEAEGLARYSTIMVMNIGNFPMKMETTSTIGIYESIVLVGLKDKEITIHDTS